jgi:hypothetical protein
VINDPTGYRQFADMVRWYLPRWSRPLFARVTARINSGAETVLTRR